MYSRRWLAVVAAVVIIGAVETLSDTLFDAVLTFPLHTLLVLAVVTAVTATGAGYSFHRIDRLAGDLRERNTVLQSRNAVLRAVYDVSLAVSGQADPEQTIVSIVDHARSLLKVDAALLAIDGPAGELQLRATSGGPGVLIGDGQQGVMGHDESELDCFLRSGYQVAISEPVGHGENRVGMLALVTASGAGRRFEVSEVEMLSGLATQIGLALEASRIQGELRVLAIQAERERIAREMHDGLAQVLAYVNTKSQAVEELLADGRVADARRQLAELAAAARSVYVDVREAILSLSTPAPSDRGVVAALEEYAALYAESSKLAVKFNASAEAARAQLSAVAQAEVFSIAREALTNVRKHARAHRVGVSVAIEGGEIVLSIQDDGVGFEAELLATGPERWPHFGLAGMRERAESVGGRITWRSRPGAGTLVELRIPVGETPWSNPPIGVAPADGTEHPDAQHQAVRSPAAAASEAD